MSPNFYNFSCLKHKIMSEMPPVETHARAPMYDGTQGT